MNRNELENEPTILSFFALVSPADRTRANYLTSLMHYTEYTGQTPTELIAEANADIKAGKLMTERTVFTKIPAFRQHLQTIKTPQADRLLAPGTLNKYVNSVCSFYKYFYIEVPKQPRSQNKVKPVKANMKKATKDDIRQAQEVCNLRDNAVMLCGVSSGMGASELSSLTLQAFYEGYDAETEITTFDMRRGKVEVDFITFISPEASRAVIKYLEWRDRPPARPENQRDVTEYEKRRTTKGSYIFITNKVSPEYLTTHDEMIRKCKPDTIIRVYNRMSCNANMCAPKGVYNPIRSHNMRKFFVSTLKNNGCDSDIVEYFVGHTLGGSKDAYYEGDPDKLRYIYKKFIPFITIRKDIDVAESPEYQAIKHENVILQAETARHVVERSELATVKAELDEMKRDNEIIKEVMKRIDLSELLKK
jgi:integrase